MATLLVCDAEIAACLPPLGTVRRDSAATFPRVRQEVRQLVAQGAVDLVRTMRAQQWIECHQVVTIVGTPCGGAKSRAPLHANGSRDARRPHGAQHFSGLCLEGRVTPGGRVALQRRRRVRRARDEAAEYPF